MAVHLKYSLSPDTWVGVKYTPIHPLPHQCGGTGGEGLMLPSPRVCTKPRLSCRCVWSSFGKHRHRADKTCLGPCAGSLWRHQFPLLGCPHIGFILVVPGGENGIKHSDRRSSLVCKQMPLTTTDHLVTSMGSQARGSFNWKWRKEDQVRSESPHVHPIIPGTLMCPYDGHTYYTPSSHSPRLA